MGGIDHFVPGKKPEAYGPLARYARPLPAEVVTAYIEAYTETGEVVLDPFCRTETVALQATASGRRAIAVDANPINVLAVKVALNPPRPRQLDAATARLGDTPKLGVPLREHLNQLYRTTCSGCGEPVIADYFVWDREKGEPIEKHYGCQTCTAERLEEVDRFDLEALERVEKQGFHYWYILRRLAPADDDKRSRPVKSIAGSNPVRRDRLSEEETRDLVRRLLDLYTPRNLYALANLLIKIETVFANSPLQDALRLILLRCLDTCSVLNASPTQEPRPRHLHPPAKFVERNVWQAFEESYRELRQRPPLHAIRLAESPSQIVGPRLKAQDTAPNAAVKRATAGRLAEELPEGSAGLIIGQPPGLDRVFWSLSYLWSGWLFGKDEAAALKPLLRPRVPRWSWYLQAIASAFRSLRQILRPQGRLVLIFTTQELAHSAALILAASKADLRLESLLYQPCEIAEPSKPMAGTLGQHRLSFVKEGDGMTPPPSVSDDKRSRSAKLIANSDQVRRDRLSDAKRLANKIRGQALVAAREVLRQRGEPLAFDWLHNAIYQRLSQEGLLREVMTIDDPDFSPLDFVTEQITLALERGLNKELTPLVVSEDQEEEKPWPLIWWLRKPGRASRPLGDRVERAAYEVLSGQPWPSRQAAEEAIYALFPGLLTPEAQLVEECLLSYGAEEASGWWRLREEDRLEQREGELIQMIGCLAELGRQLDFGVWISPQQRKEKYSDGKLGDLLSARERQFKLGPLGWVDVIWHEGKRARHIFVVQWTAVLSDPLLARAAKMGEAKGYVVIPEERAALAAYKIRRSILLRQAMAEGRWQFIKYSSLCHLLQERPKDRRDLRMIVGLEPLVEKPEAQLPLL